ncbi:hypothetical protein NKR23_g10910 [Pleurostoma richardsiae]|uniref:Uncharacterized protein n=1 Tax=Pleurostoma richardsiae TaxID=41990 RepID=A0AA38RBV0_9PEZI|nr:hypothetical protein NKR23_g10910 [Pleurostoma richardsiae]
MGLVHPLLVVGMVRGRLRPLAALDLKFADPGWDMVQVTSRILSYLVGSQRYIDSELAWAETLPEDEWSRDVEAEYRLRKKELENLPEDRSKSKIIEELKAEVDRLKQGCLEIYVPKFPVVHTCLLLGAISSDWESTYLHSVGHRPWNSPPNWGGKYMWEPGCTVINLTDRSYAFVVPAKKSCGMGDDESYLALQPISGHQWLRGFGHHSDPKTDEVWICEGGTASVMSEEALQEVWPSFLQDERSKKDSKDEDGEDEDGGDEDGGDEDGGDEDDHIKDERPKNEDIKDENTTSDYDKVENGNDEEEHRNGNAEQDGPAAKKRKREPEASSGRVVGIIDSLLDSCPQIKLLALKATKGFLPELERYSREHPERFAAGCSGAVPLLLAALTHDQGHTEHLKLNRFNALSGDQVVELVKAIVARNATMVRGEEKPLELLDLSFNASVTRDHIRRILDVTNLKELLIWNNASLPLEEVAKVAGGRIAKVTTRAGFLAPLEKWVRQCFYDADDPVRIHPVPPTAPTQTRIRQVVWMMLVTEKADASKPPTNKDGQLQIPIGALSLEDFDAETLAVMLHPMRHRKAYSRHDRNRIFSELVAFPHHDAWTPLAEVYTSLASIEKFMSNRSIIENAHGTLTNRWPLVFPLMMATGDVESEWAVSSPFPAEAFHHAMFETQSFEKPMRIHGPDPIVRGEYTLVFLREPDLGRLRVGLVTRDATGRLEVHDPGAAARAAGDEEAASAWENGIGKLPAWSGKGEEGEQRYCRNTMLLGAAAVEIMWAAAEKLSAQENEICQKIYKWR